MVNRTIVDNAPIISKSKLEKRNVTLHDLYAEFKANGVLNLSKDQIRQVRLFEAKKAASLAQQFQEADPHDRRSKWFLDQGKRYEFDPTLKPPRWVSSLRDDKGRNVQLLQEEKRRKSSEKTRKVLMTTTSNPSRNGALIIRSSLSWHCSSSAIQRVPTRAISPQRLMVPNLIRLSGSDSLKPDRTKL